MRSYIQIGNPYRLHHHLVDLMSPEPSSIALFFAGKLINENIEAWLSIGRKILELLTLTCGWLNREAALLASLYKIKEELEKIQTIKILQYETQDGRFEINWKNLTFQEQNTVANDLSEEFKGGQIHYFRIKANDTEFEILIRGTEIIVKILST